MHKRALQSYKKFEFLKAGISKDQKNPPKKARESEVFEPFNYPGLNDSVSKVFAQGSQLKVADAGDTGRHTTTAQRRGRRFDKYTEQEFLESYLGKDYARRPDLSADPYN
mgnify:CR=1 FL=1